MRESWPEPSKPNAADHHPLLVLAGAWLFVFTAVLAALWVWN